MLQKAVVVRKDGKLTGHIVRSEACMECHACEYGQREDVYVPLTAGNWQEGDTVEIELERGRLSKASLLAYGIPLLGLLLFLAVGALFALNELWQAVCGVVGMLVGFGVLRILEPHMHAYRPHITACCTDYNNSEQ